MSFICSVVRSARSSNSKYISTDLLSDIFEIFITTIGANSLEMTKQCKSYSRLKFRLNKKYTHPTCNHHTLI